jgi:hypothetical protein
MVVGGQGCSRRPLRGRHHFPAIALSHYYEFITIHVHRRGLKQGSEAVADAERNVEVEIQAAGHWKSEVAENDKRDGLDTAASRALTATDRNRARRDRALQCKGEPKPTSKWCSRCLQDLLFSCFAEKQGGFAIFGRAAQCKFCSNDEETAVRYTHASHCH